MAPGAVFTVTIVVAEQLPIVYDIVAVPTALPVTVPPVVTDTIPDALLLQEPPEVASVSVALPPRQSVTAPGVMAAGPESTVNVSRAIQVPIL
jgi:hypothetical protein